ncbi:MAG TPA: TetR family transcriptional regulator [Gaiellaceae bacterium]|nr:TetR family transcriptional regulator [Gaiellaceae bacterium]
MASAESSSRQDRTEAAILGAAAHLVAEVGAAASMADVAAAAGVGRATLYRYFPSREDLLQALAGHAVAEAGARIAEAGLDHVPVEESLARIVRALVAVGDRYAVLAAEQIKPDKRESERLLAQPIRAVFARGIEEGVLREDISLDALLAFFGGAVGVAIKLTGTRQLGLEDAAATATTLFVDGVRAD